MCGIAVAVSSHRAERTLGWALPTMGHRGPDGSGVLELGPEQPTFEHCRLAIIDPDNREADQPFSDPTGRWTIVYNGELFNYRELRAGLARRGMTFRTQSDTEVVLQSLINGGEGEITSFRGMFAFLLWDAETRELLAARDHVGVKPLYYTVSDGVFIAASELRTVMAHPVVRPRLEPFRVVEYLSFGSVSGEGTILQGIFKLPAGHLMHFRDGRVEVSEYWDALPAGTAAPDDAAIELAERLDKAVAGALVSDVPVSLMLSGGLDSSAIAALATRHIAPPDLTAYSVSFGLPDDESDAAARLARELGIKHRELYLTHDTLGNGFADWLERLDVPSANPTWVAVSAIARAVHEDGKKVLLSGDGGDELFGGYNRWMKYLRFHDRIWAPTPRVLRRGAGRIIRPLAKGLTGDIARRAYDDGQLFVGSRPFHDDDLRSYLGPVGLSAAGAVPPETPVTRLRERFDERHPGGDQLAWMSYVALKTDLVEDYLVRLDTMGMGESIEGRVPLLDVDLVELAFRLSQAAKVGTLYKQKALFRHVVSGFLPAYITDRPKQGFCPPVADWASGLLRHRLPQTSVLVDEGLVRPEATAAVARDSSVKGSFRFWALGTLAAWCENNL